MNRIPENITEFLYWVKERTEACWQELPLRAANEYPKDDWMRGAKWIGMAESDIDRVEEKHGVKFTPDHREFLRILHTLDRKEITPYTEAGRKCYEERPYFYNWLTDEQEILSMMRWPYIEVLRDVQGRRGYWLPSWGKRPQTDEEREAIFARWYRQAPRLLPLTGHRFMVSEPLHTGNPVLSVYGSDTIIYGWNLRHYLLEEIGEYLDVCEPAFDEETGEWELEQWQEVQDIRDREYAANRVIPAWGELIEHSSGGWEYIPGKNNPSPDSPS